MAEWNEDINTGYEIRIIEFRKRQKGWKINQKIENKKINKPNRKLNKKSH
jgi:hypothetical protein